MVTETTWPNSRRDAADAWNSWEAWAQEHDPPFHLRDILRDLVGAARRGETIPYGHFCDQYGLTRGHRENKSLGHGHDVGWIASVCSEFYNIQNGTHLNLSSIVVRASPRTSVNNGLPGPGFFDDGRKGDERTKYIKACQRAVWRHFARVPRGAVSRILSGPSDPEELLDSDIEKLVRKMKRGHPPPDKWGRSRIRTNASAFRCVVLENFQGRCAICGFDVREILEAAHIRGYGISAPERMDPANGIALCPTHHTAYDRKYLRFTSRGSVTVTSRLGPSKEESVRRQLHDLDGQLLRVKPRWKVRLV